MTRLILAAFAALILSVSVGLASAVPADAFDRRANERTMLRLINEARTQRGLAPVRRVAALRRAALSHSRDMLRRDYFAHSSLSGASVSSRTRRAGYGLSGCSRWSVGEVIAWGKAARGTPESVFRRWMRSRSHRRIILGARWRDAGIGCARGAYKGLPGVIMYTVDVGRRVY